MEPPVRSLPRMLMAVMSTAPRARTSVLTSLPVVSRVRSLPAVKVESTMSLTRVVAVRSLPAVKS